MATPTSLSTRAVTIRTATSADTNAVRRVVAAANDQYAADLSADVFRAYIADLLDDGMEHGQFDLFVAELDGEVVGSVRYYPDASVMGFGFPSDWAGFRALAVHPDRRGLGIGETLVGACVARGAGEQARRRVAAAGWTNVEFTAGDVHTAELPADLDAVVGRWVLMYQSDPAHTLRRLAARVRPGGVVAMIESADLNAPVSSYPSTPAHDQIATWTARLQGAEGPIANMGMRLYRTFLDAGLPAPQLRLAAPIGGGPDWPGYALMADTIRNLLPHFTRMGAVTAAEIDIDTLEDRLRAEVVAAGGVQVLPTVVGAWSRRS